jgi:hypothetical protein
VLKDFSLAQKECSAVIPAKRSENSDEVLKDFSLAQKECSAVVPAKRSETSMMC